MGIYYSAAIVVGLPFDDMPEQFNGEVVEELMEEHWQDGLTSFNPYYDSDVRLIGYAVASSSDYQWEELPNLNTLETSAAFEKFKQLFGVDGKLYLTPNGG